MLSDIALRVVPVLGRLDVTADDSAGPGPGTIVVANHSSLIDPGVVLAALARGQVVVVYPEGRLPLRRDSADRTPESFRSGVARLALATGAPVVPLGQAGARRITSGGRFEQLAGLFTAPLRRPRLHVHLGAPVRLSGTLAEATAQAHTALTAAWVIAATLAGSNGCAPDRGDRGRR